MREIEVRVPRQLLRYAEGYPGPKPFRQRSGDPVVRMEEFLKDLFYGFQQAKRGSTTALAYSQMVEIYARIVSDTTNWIGLKDPRKLTGVTVVGALSPIPACDGLRIPGKQTA